MARKRISRPPVLPPPRDPVARSPLMRKGGPHGKTRAAERRAARMATIRLVRRGMPDEPG